MSTFREAVYMVLDMFKEIHDDAYYAPEHIMFLLDKYRAYVLKTRADKDPSFGTSYDDNYQTITLSLEEYIPVYDTTALGRYLRTSEEAPSIMDFSSPEIYGADFFNGTVTYVDNRRFKYVGNNKYTKGFIYCTHGDDGYLYLRSCDPNFLYLEKITISAIFDDCLEAAEIEAAANCCDVLDVEFPLEADLLPLVCDYVYKELSQATYRPQDKANNASDDLSGLTVYGDNAGRSARSRSGGVQG